MSNAPRKQCSKCPWKDGVNPRQIPGEYCETKHKALKDTIARPGTMTFGALRMMACHETPPGEEQACVGWLLNQLGPGNNIALRLAVMSGRVNGNVETVGEQRQTFEATLPRARRKAVR